MTIRYLIPLVLQATCLWLAVICGGCKATKAPYDPSQAKDINRIILYDIDPSRNPEAYTMPLDQLETLTHSDFNRELFCKYLTTATYSKKGSFHRGGNLVIIVHKDGTTYRMMLAYSGSLRSKEKGMYSSTNESLQNEFRGEHRRIVEDVFIPARKKR
jgi:hypothetical protein